MDIYEKLSAMLPDVLEKISQSAPNIGELRILQMGGSEDSGKKDPTKAASFQLAQAIAFIRELVSAAEPAKKS